MRLERIFKRRYGIDCEYSTESNSRVVVSSESNRQHLPGLEEEAATERNYSGLETLRALWQDRCFVLSPDAYEQFKRTAGAQRQYGTVRWLHTSSLSSNVA
jgi:hypothetical protein